MMIVQRLLLCLLLSFVSFAALAQTPTTFTYQGRLYNTGTLANGSYVLRILPTVWRAAARNSRHRSPRLP